VSFISVIKKRKISCVGLLLTFVIIGNISSIILIYLEDFQFINNFSNSNNNLKDKNPISQGIVQDEYIREWLDNPTFETPIEPWYNTTEGDISDINATVDSNQANYEVLGEKNEYEFYSDLTQDSNWNKSKNPNFPAYPDTSVINASGACVSHYWDESADQSVAVNWNRMLTMPINMSDYFITSANLTAIFNATVQATPSIDDNYPNEFTGAIDVMSDSGVDTNPTGGYFQGSTGDYVRFYVWISDPANDSIFEIAYNQTADLGQDSPLIDHLDDTVMVTIPKNVLIFYLTSVLSYNFEDFRILIGMRIWCEDNFGQDADNWQLLIIKSVNLTFTYEKKINQFTSLAWSQVGDKISGSNIDINNATLNFKYKIDQNWTNKSPNSEIRIFINNNQYAETIKLSIANSTFQDGKVGGFDVTNLILKNVNITLSIEVYIADTFPLDPKYTISIDNASLVISYTETTVEEITRLDILLNSQNKTLEKSIEVTMGYDVNITVMYKDSLNSFIPNATVKLLGSGSPIDLDEDLIYNQYSSVISSTELSLGNNFFTIEASKKYYETVSELINIKVIERNTELVLFLDGENKTIDKSIEMIYGNNGNITITYKDTEEVPYTHISGATVELIGLATPVNLTEDVSNEQYYKIIDTADLGLGNSFLTINAYKENYTSQSIRFKIEVLERNSYLDNIKLNGIETDSIEIAWNELLSITVSYNDSLTDNFIEGALVELTGEGVSGTFNESAPIEYSFDLSTPMLSLGVNFLTISAVKENYTLASRIISVSVTERDTLIDVYLNGSLSSTFDLYNISIGEELNVSVIYKDLITDNFIDLATVRLFESGIPQNLTKHPFLDQYNISIMAEDLGAGVKFLSISAKQTNYTLSSELITLIVNEKKTQLQLFLNGTQYLNGETIQLEVNDKLNVTVKYLDNITMNFLNGATVDLIGDGLLSENISHEYYNITINVLDLNSTLNRLAIRAQLTNYQTTLIEFFIQVIERQSDGRLILNGIDKTFDPYIELTIGSLLNITVNYYDNKTSNHISGAIVQLSGDLTEVIEEDLFYNQYSKIINTTELGVGLSIFTIIAEKANFELFIIQKLYLSVNRIRTNVTTISGESTFIIKPGESITLSIILNDLDFGGRILGANVNYRWVFGSGTFSDNDNDGIYTVTLKNIPEGSYSIFITALKGDDYNFESYEIVISVIRPPEQLLLFQSLAIGGGILAAALVTYLYLYQKILKFPKPVRKVRKYSKSLKRTKAPSVNVISRDKAFEGAYKEEVDKASKTLRIKPSEPSLKPDKIITK